MSSTGYRKRSRTIPHPWAGRVNIPTGRIILHKWGAPPGVDDVNLGTVGVEGVSLPFLRIETCEDQLHAGPPYREGGPLTSIKCDTGLPSGVIGHGKYHSGSAWISIFGVGTGSYTYEGGFCNPAFKPYDGGFNMTSQSQVASQMGSLVPDAAGLWGSDAWNKTKPHLEKAGLAVSLAEIRDVPKMLSKTAKVFNEAWKLVAGSARKSIGMAPKKAADHFLNHQFGWVPFISDVEKIINTAINSRDIISKLSADNNRFVRRRRTLVVNSRSFMASKDLGWYMEPGGSTYGNLMDDFGTTAYREIHVQETTHVTSSGSFRYYRPEFDMGDDQYWSLLNQMKRHLTIHGARINPSVVYNATPWTWLIDWFSNAGDHVDMITDWGSDGLVAKYLFVMAHTSTSVKFKQFVPWKSGPRSYECDRVIDIKQRVNANTPYGFSLSWGDLTSRQLAILGALGLSRKG